MGCKADYGVCLDMKEQLTYMKNIHKVQIHGNVSMMILSNHDSEIH